MAFKRTFRVVLASPSDVQAERDAAAKVIDTANQILRGPNFRAIIELVRWETDAHPGMHPDGPQGLIDERLRIEDSDVVIGVFRRRFGTPVSDADSGTEHEIRRAIGTWRTKGAPQVMLYFCDAPYEPGSPADEEQFQKVEKFKHDLISTDKLLIWTYRDVAALSDFLLTHLLNVAVQQLLPRPRSAGPFSFLRVSASANSVCARQECLTELMGDVFLRCTYDGDTPARMHATVTLAASAPIARHCSVALFEVGRAGATANLIPGVMGPPGTNEVTFRVPLSGIGPRETRIFQISNLRCAAYSGFSFVLVYATITGAPIEDAQQRVATIRKGLVFEARTADNSGLLADRGFETRRSADPIERRIATLRFTEGFPNAFKSRAPIPGLNWNTYEGDAVSTGESGQSCPVFATAGVAGRVSGLADYGTCLQAKFSNLQAGVRIFVSESELGCARRARLLTWASASSPGDVMTIGGLEVRELPTQDGGALAVWEVMTPFFERSAGLADFAVFASYASEPAANLPSLGTSHVAGSFSPVVAGYSGSGPVPQFISNTQEPPRSVLTVVP